MEPLSPRSTNVKVRSVGTENLMVKAVQRNAAAAVPPKSDKDLPGTPPAKVLQPVDRDGNAAVTYDVGRLLGTGGFASCYVGHPEHLPVSKGIVALKVFRTELQIHSKMSHPNIVQFHQAFTFESYTYLVLEMCSNGSVMDMLRARRCLTLPEARRFIIQMCGAVKYMHDREVLHRDLKMSNIFLDEKMDIKLGDLGLAAILVSEKDASSIRRTTLCGTPNYIAPEILNKARAGHDAKVDVWSLGVIIFAMLDGITPFAAKSHNEIYRRIKERKYEWSEKKQKIPAAAKDLVASILVEAEQRPSLDDIASHKFLRSGWVPGDGEIDAGCLKEKPRWLPIGKFQDLPSGMNDWKSCCESAGVGFNHEANEFFLKVGESAGTSIYLDIKYEAQLNRTPQVPIQQGDVYSRLPAAGTVKQEKTGSRRFVDKAQITAALGAPPLVTEPQREAHPIFGTTLQDQMRARRIPTRPKPLDQVREVPEIGGRLLDGGAKRQTALEPITECPASKKIATTQSSSDLKPTGGLRAGARRAGISNSQSSRTLRSDIIASELRPQPLRIRAKKDDSAPKETLTGSTGQSEMHELQNDRHTAGQLLKKEEIGSVSSRPSTSSKKGLLSDTENEAIEYLPGTGLRNILSGVMTLETNIGKALSRRRPRVAPKKPHTIMPYVVKWVDYTNKFGIGYSLNDGTSGCIFAPEQDCPSICIIVRNGEKHAQQQRDKSYEDRHEIVPQSSGQPIEFLENHLEKGLRQVLVEPTVFRTAKKGDGRFAMLAATSLADARRKRFAKLWSNFASYMENTIRNSEISQVGDPSLEGTDQSIHSVRFFQRFGDVFVYGFTSGIFQFNFPDHSKIILSADGKWCDFHHLDDRAIRRMEQGSRASESDFEGREVLSQPLADYFHQFKRKPTLDDIHQFEAKLNFVRDVLKRWMGSGSLGGGFPVGDGLKEVRYEGICEQPQGTGTQSKLIWASCGAVPTEQTRYMAVN
ncbi:MAG: Cell cycle serine/threonine-protein kinase cdc5/MSD2 [Vezdaea aestivalis]|nr:MAG: Cell cycle serine/threonine-protein kinase cdc5/MSD2 [Vezdaea aestivalis]